jgi:putative sterol carrier protein
LTHKTFFRPELARGVNETYELHIDHEVLQVQIQEGEIHVHQGAALKADLVLHSDMPAYLDLFVGKIQADEAISKGLIRIEGDPSALHRLLAICGLQDPTPSA